MILEINWLFYFSISSISSIIINRRNYWCLLYFFAVPETDSVQTQEMKATISNLRSLLKECFRQLQEERKQSANLLNQVAELESKVLTYNQVITQLLNQQVQHSSMPYLINKSTFRFGSISRKSCLYFWYISFILHWYLAITFTNRKRIWLRNHQWGSSGFDEWRYQTRKETNQNLFHSCQGRSFKCKTETSIKKAK